MAKTQMEGPVTKLFDRLDLSSNFGGKSPAFACLHYFQELKEIQSLLLEET